MEGLETTTNNLRQDIPCDFRNSKSLPPDTSQKLYYILGHFFATQVVANFPAICENQRFITVFSRSQQLHPCTFCRKIVVSIVLPSVLMS